MNVGFCPAVTSTAVHAVERLIALLYSVYLPGTKVQILTQIQIQGFVQRLLQLPRML